jgi:hypothetical protein
VASDSNLVPLRVIASFVVIAGLLVPATAPAKKLTAGKLPPGLARKVVDQGPGSDVVTPTTKALKRAARAKPPRAERRPRTERPPKAAKPERADKPRETDKEKDTDTEPTEVESSQNSPPAATAAPTTRSTPVAATEAVAPAGSATPLPGSSAEQARGRTTRSRKPAAHSPRGARTAATSPASAVEPASSTSAEPPTSDGAGRRDTAPAPAEHKSSPVVRTVRDIVEIVPGWMKLAIAALGALSLLLAGAYFLSAVRARSLARQRSELLGEVGLLQKALLPAVPDELGGLKASVAYRPADGPAAGGDFYDALPLSDGRVGFILGDISGHGRGALERTAFMRYTLRAYLEAGLEPSVALQVAGRVIGDGLGDDFATVLLAVHDPHDGSLTYATAGHPAPIVVGGGTAFEPVIAGSSPPIGIGEPTGLRQTTVPLVPHAVACLYTDGLIEARTADGLLGRDRLEQLVRDLRPEATASELLERVAAEATEVPDDMASCLLTPRASVTSGGFRTEQLELSADELDGPLLARFLEQCGVQEEVRLGAGHEAAETARRFGGAIVSVVFGSRRTVDVRPRNVESIEVASRRTRSAAPPDLLSDRSRAAR